MFGNNEYWWGGLIALLVFIGINLGVFFLRKDPGTCYRIAFVIATYLLFYKVAEYIYHQAAGDRYDFPVEFSALSYFLFGVTVFFRLKKVEPFGVFCGVLTGAIYYASLVVAPDNHIEGLLEPHPYFAVMAIVNHTLLYIGAVLLFARVRKYDVKKTGWMLPLGVGIMIAYCWIIHLFTRYSEVRGKPLFIQITDGSIVAWLVKGDAVPAWANVLYYIAALSVLLGFMVGFYLINNKLAQNRAKRSLPEDYFPKTYKDVFKKA